MKRRYIGLAMVAMVAVGALLLGSCGFKRQLVSIAITPDGANIQGVGVIVNFQAIGTYVHPPDTRDITNSVVWASSAPQIISIDSSTGVAVSGDGCGSNITITATSYSNPETKSGRAVVGTATASVTQHTCP